MTTYVNNWKLPDFDSHSHAQSDKHSRCKIDKVTSTMSDLQYTLVGKTTNCNDSRLSLSTPVLRNNTGTRVCGIQSANTTSIRSCCDGDVQLYWCNSYCETSLSMAEFSKCWANNTNTNDTYPGFAYCQRSISNTQNETIQTSAGLPRTGSPSRLLLALFLTLLAVLPASAFVVDSLDNGLMRRQSDDSQCDFDIDSNYTSQGPSVVLTATFGGSSFSAVGTEVTTGTKQNNRTVNDTSAAEPQYDAFFGVLANLTSRRFPALSGVSLFCMSTAYSPTVPSLFPSWNLIQIGLLTRHS